VKKQRKQMELIQERREQLELMLDWKKSLTEFEDEKVTMVSDYWTSMMKPYSLNENGLNSLGKLIKKFPIEDILESIDIANKKYLTFDDEGKTTKESVEEAFNKVGGICALKNMPELKQKMAYIKGICRNRFSYWDNRKGSIILNNYVSALKEVGWSDERITEDLEKEVMPKSKEFENWTQWRELLEKWTDDIINWSNEQEPEPKPEPEPEKPKEFKLETLETYANVTVGESEDKIQVLEYFGKAFPKFNSKNFRKSVLNESLIVLNADGVEKEDIVEFTQKSDSLTYFEIKEPYPENLGFLMVIETSAIECMITLFDSFNISSSYYSEKDRKILKMLIKERINNIA
jgi:hypothetical protein